jgi:hypothetical protein
MSDDDLEEEKKALLERMHASRRAYRARFVHEEEAPPPEEPAFPRSRTFRFLTRHPCTTALGVLAALAVVPRRSLGRAVKGGAALAAGALGRETKTLMVRHLLPAAAHWVRSNKRR